LSQINDPYGCNLQIGYITPFTGVTVPGSLTDAAGMTSSFGYQGVNGWLTSLTTPYGTTRFNYTRCRIPPRPMAIPNAPFM